MKREERVLKIPPLAISLATADKFLAEINSLALEQRDAEFEKRLRNAYRSDRAGTPVLDPAAISEADFVKRNLNNQEFRAMAELPAYQKHIFLAKSGNVIFDSSDFTLEELPKDIYFCKSRADGINGRFIELQLKTDFQDFNDARNWQANQLIVQGEDRNWVNGVYERFRLLIESERLGTRKLVYGNILILFWSSLVLLLFGEYRIAKWLYPTFNLKEPLSGTGALVMFGVLLGSIVMFANLFLPLCTYWFPYFEVEGNISRGRFASRKVVIGVASAIYTAAIINLLALVFGPALVGRFGHP